MDDQFEGLTDAPAEVPALGPETLPDLPMSLGTLPDGHDTVVIGDVGHLAELNHQQGDNPYGVQQDCGLVAAENVLKQFGFDVTERDMIEYAVAHGLCDTSAPDPSQWGGTTPELRAQLLTEMGVPAHAETGSSLEDLARDCEQGTPVIIGANAGYLWHDPQYVENGQSNHAVVVTGVSRDPETGEIQGFYVNDSGSGQGAVFIDAQTMTDAWLNAGGKETVTDVVPGETNLTSTGAQL